MRLAVKGTQASELLQRAEWRLRCQSKVRAGQGGIGGKLGACHRSVTPIHPCTHPQACPASFPGPQPLQSPPPSKDRQVRPVHHLHHSEPYSQRLPPEPRVCQRLTYRAADQPDFPPPATLLLRWPLLTRVQQGRAATSLKVTQLCPTQASGPQSMGTTLSSRAPSAPLHGIMGQAIHVLSREPSPSPPLQGGPCRQAPRPAAHCVPGRPAALQASAGHGRAPAHTPHRGCPQYPW